MSEAQARASQAEVKTRKAETIAEKALEVVSEAQARASQAEAISQNTWLNYQLVINSRSWRITAPIRLMLDAIKWFLRGSVAWLTLRPGSRPRRAARQGLLHLRNWVFLRPRIKEKILLALQYMPIARKWLKRLHHAQPFVSEKHSSLQSVNTDQLDSNETSENKSLAKISGLHINDGLDVSDNEVAEQSHKSILSGETSLENQLLEATNRWSLGSRIHE